jgi:hypothetical protein
VSTTLRTLPGDAAGVVADGTSFLGDPPELRALAAPDAVAWESAPGGQAEYTAQVAGIAESVGWGTVEHHEPVTCNVPAVSALDIDQPPDVAVLDAPAGASPFHAYRCSEQNQLHLVIEPGVSRWLLEELGAPGGGGPVG